ncbi:MAG: alpha/beta hydrolase, partial [Cyanobacteriota bacterium]|nr:alpha/beta hydrolase [Cyanobacteriota bacterium]
LGFSMGGVIGRIWLQELGGAQRTRRFFSVGSPQQGTFAAQMIPRPLLAGAADMKVGSRLLRDLNRQTDALAGIECSSFFCRWDLMVCPGWKAVLPLGRCEEIPVWTHQQLISHPDAIRRLCSSLRA